MAALCEGFFLHHPNKIELFFTTATTPSPKTIPTRWQHYVKYYYFPTHASTTSPTINSHQMARTPQPSPWLKLTQNAATTVSFHAPAFARALPPITGFPQKIAYFVRFFLVFLCFLFLSIYTGKHNIKIKHYVYV